MKLTIFTAISFLAVAIAAPAAAPGAVTGQEAEHIEARQVDALGVFIWGMWLDLAVLGLIEMDVMFEKNSAPALPARPAAPPLYQQRLSVSLTMYAELVSVSLAIVAAFGRVLGQAIAFAAFFYVLASAVDSASPLAATSWLAYLLFFFLVFFPRLRKEYIATSALAVLGGLLAHFYGAGSYSFGMFATLPVALVSALGFKRFLGFIIALWKHTVAAVGCLAIDLASRKAKLAMELQTYLEMFVCIAMQYSKGATVLRDLFEEEARCHAQELRFAEQASTFQDLSADLSARVADFCSVHPNRKVPGCVGVFQQIPLAEKEDGHVVRSLSITWKRLLSLVGFYTIWLETELARLKAVRVKRDEVIKERQEHIASGTTIQKIIVKETAAHPVANPLAVARRPSRVSVPKPDRVVPAPPSPSQTQEEKKEMSVFEICIEQARSKRPVLPVIETDAKLPQTPDHSHTDPPASPAPAPIVEDVTSPLSDSAKVQRAFDEVARGYAAGAALDWRKRERCTGENQVVLYVQDDETMLRRRKESAVTKEARLARERSRFAYQSAQAEKEKMIAAPADAVTPAVVTDAELASAEVSKVTSAPATPAADPISVLPEDTPAQADAVAPPPSDDLMSELRVALASRGRSIRKATRADGNPSAKLKAASNVPAPTSMSTSGDEWITEDELDECDDSDGESVSSDEESDGPRGPDGDDDSDSDDEDAGPPPGGAPSAILAVVEDEQDDSPSETVADTVADNDEHGSPGPAGAPVLPEADVSYDSEAGVHEQADVSTRDVVVCVGDGKQSEHVDDEPETSYEEEGEDEVNVGIDEQLLAISEFNYPSSTTMTITSNEAESSYEEEAEQMVLFNSTGCGLMSEGMGVHPPVGSSTVVCVEAQTENAADVTDITGSFGTLRISTTSAAQAVAAPPVTMANIFGDFTATTDAPATTPAAFITSPEFGIVQTWEAAGSGTHCLDALPGMELDEELRASEPDSMVIDEEVGQEDFRMEKADAEDEGEDTAMDVIVSAEEEGCPAVTDWGFGSLSLSGTPFTSGVFDGDVDMAPPRQQEDEENAEMADQGVVGDSFMYPSVEAYPSLPSREGDMRFGEAGDVLIDGPAREWSVINEFEGGNHDGFGEQQQGFNQWPQQQQYPAPLFGDFGEQQPQFHFGLQPQQYPEAPFPGVFGQQQQQQWFHQWPQHQQQQQQQFQQPESHRDVEGSYQPQFQPEVQQPLFPSQSGNDFSFQLEQSAAHLDFGQGGQSSSEVASASQGNDDLTCPVDPELEEIERALLEALTTSQDTWSDPDMSLIDPQLLALPSNPTVDVADGEGSSSCVVTPVEDVVPPTPIVPTASPPSAVEAVANQGEEEKEEETGVSAPTAAPVVTFPEQEISFTFEARSDVFESAPAEEDYVDSYVPVSVVPLLRPEVDRRRREPRSNGSTPVEVVRTDDRQDEVPPVPDSLPLEESVRQRVAARPMLRPRLRASNAVRQAVAEQAQEVGGPSSAAGTPQRELNLQEMRARIEAMRRAGASNFEEDPSSPASSTTSSSSSPSPRRTTSEEPEPVAEGSSSSAEVKEGQQAEEQKLKSSEVEAHQGEEAVLQAAVAGGAQHETRDAGRRKRSHVDEGDGDVAHNVEDALGPPVIEGRRILPCRGRLKRANEEPD
ncbi:hypothetical protein QBC40DRAFT_347558 [Triangularia verruculosa]|uniref:Uncharacterized protein n=1 Tax=Triangularia verruculosa TaxID=2587418 RepID=A0AAN7AW76_9PEZI|nr:hypothetical protein QBC40DRAFT_347558 [Triangularia verruculosa]